MKLFARKAHIYSMKKKIISRLTTLSVIAGLSSCLIASSAYAVEPNTVRGAIRQEIRQETLNLRTTATAPASESLRKEIRQETQNLRQNIVDTIKSKIKSLLPHRIHGKIASIAADKLSLVVTTDKGDITVFVTAKTQLKRRFGGNSSVGEFAVGDEVAIIGSEHGATVDSSSSASSITSIDARYIRDISIQRRNTVFVGSITTKAANSFTVQTVSRGLQTVHVDASTEYQLKNGTTTFAALQVGDRVLVKGEIWDRATANIDAKKIIKLPLVPTPSNGGTSSGASSI